MLANQEEHRHDDGGGSSELDQYHHQHPLPDDMLADVLGRLPSRSLAASRCVGKHWCALIDARRLLRADLLPLHLDAFFFNPNDYECFPSSFARPSSAARRRRFLDYFSDDDATRKELPDYMNIEDHCNGLLLLRQMVLVNPATRQWANLPDHPGPTWSPTAVMYTDFYLVYEPMVSPQHYEVFAIPEFSLEHPPNSSDEEDDDYEEEEEELVDPSAEWPPSSFTVQVFSSRKWRWEERSFVRQGEPAGTIADMRRSGRYNPQAVYFQGALYVHCQNDYVMRIALSDDTYRVIRPPVPGTTPFGEDPPPSYLGKSEKGVYTALLHEYDGVSFPCCHVWFLNGHMEWVLKSTITLVENIPVHPFADEYSKQWTMTYKKGAPAQDELDDEWDFDDGIVLETIDNNKPNQPYGQYRMFFLGFHPYKEIVFFCVTSCQSSRAVSYHLNTSKVQDLGTLLDVTETESSFPYTPCWMGELFENN